ncbi:MAG: DUF2293 domain-containing protein [Verrucomicrobia bacterium]|nr:DUF2293 domain-containing protein [Verrucomicrobiota bacterium]
MTQTADSDAILVFPSQGEGDCAHCAAPLYQSAFVTFKNNAIACVKCGGLENLEFLPSGNTALTRRATALSEVKYVVLKFSRARKRYERQGILARPEILDRASRECEAYEAAREAKRQASSARRDKQDAAHLAAFAARIRELYPSAPLGVEHEIATHACRKYSGRVGRAAFAKELAPESIHLAVRAHIRHHHTSYDRLMSGGADRSDARLLVTARIEETTRRWLKP